MATKKNDTKEAGVWCNETQTVPGTDRFIVCERQAHERKLGEYAHEDDENSRFAHRAWYNGREYEWGGVPSDGSVKALHQGFRVASHEDGSTVYDLCGRELYKTVSFQAGVTTFSGLLVGIKHFCNEDNPMKPMTKIKLKRGEDTKTIILEKQVELKIYRRG